MKQLSIPGEFDWEIKTIHKGEDIILDGCSIVTVVHGRIFERIKGVLKTFESSIFYSGKITAEEDSLVSVFKIHNSHIALNKIDVEKVFGEYCRSNWKKLCELPGCESLSETDLYRGDQFDFDFQDERYKFNLWFCGADVDCLWHNQHNFIETHTNIAGDGFMQKSLDGTDTGLVETYGLLPGNSHRTFNIVNEFEENGSPKYPMHRWLGGKTGNIWFVIEKY